MTKDDDSEGKLIDLMLLLTQEVSEITEFNKRELKAISILSINPFMRRFFTSNDTKNLDYIDNKKHLKRKHSKELLKLVKYISNAIMIKCYNE